MIHIHIASIPAIPKDPELIAGEFLRRAAQAALNHSTWKEAHELTILVSDDHQLQDLNRQFMGIDAPTDVLTFTDLEQDPESGELYLGDIVISYQRAAIQAAARGHPVEAELQLLVVHGILHLMGYDHAEVEEKEAMWSLQQQILSDLGITIHSPDD